MAGARPPRRLAFDHGHGVVIALRSGIESNLRGFQSVASPAAQLAAAVAIVLVEAAGEPCVPIFQRTARMRRHAGQMALPGGRTQEGETAEEAAIRELHEELGLAVDPDDVLGRLDDFDTRSGFATGWAFPAWYPARRQIC